MARQLARTNRLAEKNELQADNEGSKLSDRDFERKFSALFTENLYVFGSRYVRVRVLLFFDDCGKLCELVSF